VPIDHDAALKEAEHLLRQGKLDGAIEAYVRLVEDRPSDWNSINTLGDLCLRVGDVERAITQFTSAADEFSADGALQKATALYKKAFKAQGDGEPTLRQLGETAARQGLPADAEVYRHWLADRRRYRGDERADADHLSLAEGAVPEVDAPPEIERPFEVAALPEIEAPLEVEAPFEVDALPAIAAPLGADLSDAVADIDAAPAVPAAAPPASPCEPEPERVQVGGGAEDVAELESAARDLRTRFTAAAALGRLHVRQGDLRAGTEWLERAVDAPPAGEEERFAALHDLADTLERHGEMARALAVLIELDLDSIGYRDGRARIDRLVRAQDESPGQ